MNCLYCEKPIDKITISNLLFNEDKLCQSCRKQMKYQRLSYTLKGLNIETFYDYNSLFKSILIQYKECYDEALKDVFLVDIKDYIKIKYRGYKILYVPSTKEKLVERGFDHLREIFKELGFIEVKGLVQKEALIQEGKDLAQRTKMLENYQYNGPYLDKVLIVDDVITTGSSVLGVYNAIRPFCTKVRTIVLSNAKTIANIV